MTGEMSKAEVTSEAYPLHFAVAKALRGTVEPFDTYQGPYIRTPRGHRLFICSDDGAWACIWNEQTSENSCGFPYDEPMSEVLAVAAATSMISEQKRKR